MVVTYGQSRVSPVWNMLCTQSQTPCVRAGSAGLPSNPGCVRAQTRPPPTSPSRAARGVAGSHAPHSRSPLEQKRAATQRLCPTPTPTRSKMSPRAVPRLPAPRFYSTGDAHAIPPATTALVPVVYEASSLRRKATVCTTSSTVPSRFIGTPFSLFAATTAGSRAK